MDGLIGFTVDTEECNIQREFSIPFQDEKMSIDVSETGAMRLLDLLDETEIKATFFITGFLAQERPYLVSEIINRGHEIACHGLHHESLITYDYMTQKRKIKQATETIALIAGEKPSGFRAPMGFINAPILKILESLNYEYDSSILPTFIPGRYNHLLFPTSSYHPSEVDLSKKGRMKILEIPLSVVPYVRMPIGWWWMRNLGLRWTILGSYMVLRRNLPVIFNIHSWEVVKLPRIKGVPRHIYNRAGKQTYNMLETFLNYFRERNVNFTTMKEIARNSHTQANN